MSNGTEDYTLGGLNEKVEGNDKRLSTVEGKVDVMQKDINQFKGGLSTIKTLLFFVFGTSFFGIVIALANLLK